MASGGKYCDQCDCVVGHEPCEKCVFDLEFHCEGACVCCRTPLNNFPGQLNPQSDTLRDGHWVSGKYCRECDCVSGEEPCDQCFLDLDLKCNGHCVCCQPHKSFSIPEDNTEIIWHNQPTNGKYCEKCDCILGNEPCDKCRIELDLQCEGQCVCCNPFRGSPRQEELDEVLTGERLTDQKGAKSLDTSMPKTQLMPASSGDQIVLNDISFLGPLMCVPFGPGHPKGLSPPDNGVSKYCKDCDCLRGFEPCFKCLIMDCQCRGVCICCKISSSTGSAKDNPGTSGSKDTSSKKVGNSSRESLTWQEKFWKSNLGSCEFEGDPYKHITRCEMCQCIKHHLSCKECLIWDLYCNFSKMKLCTCCEKFENLLPPTD